jgi:hypothetical protein
MMEAQSDISSQERVGTTLDEPITRTLVSYKFSITQTFHLMKWNIKLIDL